MSLPPICESWLFWKLRWTFQTSPSKGFLRNFVNFLKSVIDEVLLLKLAVSSWIFFIKMCHICSINLLFIYGLFCFFLQERNIYKGLTSIFYKLDFFNFFYINFSKYWFCSKYCCSKRFNLTPRITKRERMWKFHLIFFFCDFMIDGFSFWSSSTKEAVLRREP